MSQQQPEAEQSTAGASAQALEATVVTGEATDEEDDGDLDRD